MSETIINGIDVSECEYINCCSKKAKCIILQDDILSDSQYCESEPHCYFKQLKRLQEENKELRQIRKNSPDIQEPYVYLYRQIKKQCHKLEEENKRLQMLSCANCGEKYLSPEGAELYEKNVQLQEENEKLKNILKEIRDLKKSQGIKDDVLKMIERALNGK